MMMEVAKRETPEERELRKKIEELAEIEGRLGEKELELATLKAELKAFETLYMRTVGVKYAELDEIEAKISDIKLRMNPNNKTAQEEAACARARANESREATGQVEERLDKFVPSDTLKKLYREVAKRVHPDLAEDDSETSKRQKLMAQANRAYQDGDEDRLRAILAEWEDSPESVKGRGPGADLVRIIRKIAHVESRLQAIESEIERLLGSDLQQLRNKTQEAAKEGRDLLKEMAGQLSEEIELARHALARLSGEHDNP